MEGRPRNPTREGSRYAGRDRRGGLASWSSKKIGAEVSRRVFGRDLPSRVGTAAQGTGRSPPGTAAADRRASGERQRGRRRGSPTDQDAPHKRENRPQRLENVGSSTPPS